MSRRENLAWAAGLFEGEGHARAFLDKSGHRHVQLALGMTDQDVVERFAAIVGAGGVAMQQPRGEWKAMYVWQIYRVAEVRRIGSMLLPFLGGRRSEQMRATLEMAKDIKPLGTPKEKCPQGHRYAGENLIERLERQRNGSYRLVRRCRACRHEQNRKRRRPNVAA